MDKLPARLITARQDKKLIPLVGAGVSMSLKDAAGKNLFPSWKELLQYAADALEKECKANYANGIKAMLDLDDFQQAAAYARKGLDGTLWSKFFHKQFEEPLTRMSEDSMSLPNAIWGLGNRIVTLN